MSSKLEINTAEFRKALRALPAELRNDAHSVVTSSADAAAAEIVQKYPRVTGRLRHGVKVTKETSAFGVIATVKSSAPHAHLFEYGTQLRSYQGANRGAMRAQPTFIPAVIKHRRTMNGRLVEIVRQAGFQVSGTP